MTEATLIRRLREADDALPPYETMGVQTAIDVVRAAFAAERKRKRAARSATKAIRGGGR